MGCYRIQDVDEDCFFFLEKRISLQAPSSFTKDNHSGRLRIFSGSSNFDLAHEVAQYMGLELGKIKRKRFADGEIYVQVRPALYRFQGLQDFYFYINM